MKQDCMKYINMRSTLQASCNRNGFVTQKSKKDCLQSCKLSIIFTYFSGQVLSVPGILFSALVVKYSLRYLPWNNTKLLVYKYLVRETTYIISLHYRIMHIWSLMTLKLIWALQKIIWEVILSETNKHTLMLNKLFYIYLWLESSMPISWSL